jgi:superfamily I DNA and/or RNA helicase
MSTDGPISLSEASMAYTKKFWEERPFDDLCLRGEHKYFTEQRLNKIIDLLKSQSSSLALIEIRDENNYEDAENIANNTTISFAEFLFNVVTQRGGLKSTDTENNKVLNKYYKNVTPLIKMEAWASKAPLTDEILDTLSVKVTSDVESEQFYDWTEPTSIIRLKSWVGCT